MRKKYLLVIEVNYRVIGRNMDVFYSCNVEKFRFFKDIWYININYVKCYFVIYRFIDKNIKSIDIILNSSCFWKKNREYD